MQLGTRHTGYEVRSPLSNSVQTIGYDTKPDYDHLVAGLLFRFLVHAIPSGQMTIHVGWAMAGVSETNVTVDASPIGEATQRDPRAQWLPEGQTAQPAGMIEHRVRGLGDHARAARKFAAGRPTER